MFNLLSNEVTLIEVGPRDGLQNEAVILPIEVKLKFVKLLVDSGLLNIEISSFVRGEKIPQMKDAVQLANSISYPNINLIYLVPNFKGFEAALYSKVKSIAVFTATSETFNQKNINASIDESLKKITPVIELAKSHQMYVRGYISTAFGCPYEGKVNVDKLMNLCEYFFKNGVDEISIGDTIGIANPLQVKNIIMMLKSHFDLSKIALHFHDTRGMAVANCLTALECGITRFDSSSGGLGGCPYAKNATGNVATEDLLYLFDSLGVHTGVDMKKLVIASTFILEKLNKKSTSKYLLSM